MSRSQPQITQVELTGRDLTVEQVVAVARERCPVSLAPAALHRVRCCRAMVNILVERGERVYGLTTGFGKLRDVSIAREDLERLQVNLIRSHACGVGDPFDEDVVRAAILLRANTLCRGHSGIRASTLQALVALLNDGIYPYVPQQGSVGASGDLAPLSHLALVLIGDPAGRVLPVQRRPTRRGIVRGARAEDFDSCQGLSLETMALSEAPAFRPVTLGAKEGLALNNGTQFMTAVACLVLRDAAQGLEWAEAATAMGLEAMQGVRDAFRPELHAARNLPDQAATARRIIAYTAGSQILDVLLNTGYLRRARHALHDSLDHLSAVKQALERTDPVSFDRAEEADARVVALLDELDRFLETAGDGPVPVELVRPQVLDRRRQIEVYEHMLAPLRRESTGLLQLLDQPSFPTTSLMREAVVRYLHDLSHAVPAAPPVQDDYSIRCAPQVLACAHRALSHAWQVVEVELNSATDNPLLFPPEPPAGFAGTGVEDYAAWLAEPARARTLVDHVLGGGNFHGEPIGMVLDYLAIALAEVASIAERRIAHLVDASVSNGLPPFLIESSGLNSGFMVPQYTAAALVSENKSLAHPASVDSIPTCAGSEDHVSMGTIAARQAAAVLENTLQVLAIEVMAGYQALTFRAPLRPGRGVGAVVAALEAVGLRPVRDDRVIHDELQQVRELLRGPVPHPEEVP